MSQRSWCAPINWWGHLLNMLLYRLVWPFLGDDRQFSSWFLYPMPAILRWNILLHIWGLYPSVNGRWCYMKWPSLPQKNLSTSVAIDFWVVNALVCFKQRSVITTINLLPVFFFLREQEMSIATNSNGPFSGNSFKRCLCVRCFQCLLHDWYFFTEQ